MSGYYRSSFSHSTPMNRGRGGYSSRSSYRGGSSWNTPRGGGSYSSRGGGAGGGTRFGGSSFTTSFSSRSKYSGSDTRYGTSSSKSYDAIRKPYKMDSNYSRESSGHRGPPERKKSRIEAPISRHENSSSYYGNNSGGGGGGGRYDTMSSSGHHHQNHHHRSYPSISDDHRHRHHSAGLPPPQHSPPSLSMRRSSNFRRPSGMPPPSSSLRGGRISSRRPLGGGTAAASGASFRYRERVPFGEMSRRPLETSSYAIRRRVVPLRSSTTDYARRLKISKMRSAIAARSKNLSGNSKIIIDVVDSDEENDNDRMITSSKMKESTNDTSMTTTTNIDENKLKSDVTTTDMSNVKSSSNMIEQKASGFTDGNERKVTIYYPKMFIKLSCRHCGFRAAKFHTYEQHFQSRMHIYAMRKVAMGQKIILSKMRLAQRQQQNELERNGSGQDTLVSHTNFCPLCKLNYKQRKLMHQNSEAHRKMKKFLMPNCKVCHIAFKSPMSYEHHLCTIDHLKCKQRTENVEEIKETTTATKEIIKESTNEDGNNAEDNLDNFTTVDSVGDDNQSDDEADNNAKNKKPISVGIEQIERVSAYYCNLCKMYVTRVNSETEIGPRLIKHCKERNHMQRYIRYKEDKDLEKIAEKLQRKETAEKASNKEPIGTTMETTTNNKLPNSGTGSDMNCSGDHLVQGKSNSNQQGIAVKRRIKKELNSISESTEDNSFKISTTDDDRDDKLWADVDKDLDDILAKESGNKSSDEDEEISCNERYDRFKYSEKGGESDGTTEKSAANNSVDENQEAVKNP